MNSVLSSPSLIGQRKFLGRLFAGCLLYFLMGLSTAIASTRDWSDATGKYSVNATLVAQSETTVVLRRESGDLLEFPIERLSDSDREYLKQHARSAPQPDTDGVQQWTLKSGMKLRGKILDFHEHPVTIRRRLGHLYVNDKRFDRVPAAYRKIVVEIVAHFTNKSIPDEESLEIWARKLRGQPKTFLCRGVLVELNDDHLYCIPFFLLPNEVVKSLKPGWEQWLAAKDDYAQRKRQAFLLRAQLRAQMQQMQDTRQIQQLQLNLQAYDAGLFNLWEVEMFPPSGTYAMPLRVIVPARTSEDATLEAHRRNPRYEVGSVGVLTRKY